jgi:LmbE family N-acetylglucosaminyl deacetylase
LAIPCHDCKREHRLADELGTILGVWAHPDDETYLTAGLLVRAVRNGSRVVRVTATRGEGGSLEDEKWPSATMGEVREKELLQSLAVLGVTEHQWLDLPDVDMDTPLPEKGAGTVRAIIKSVSRWATEGFHQVAKPGAKMFYATTTPDWAERWVPVYNRFNVFRPGTPPVTLREELGIEYDLPPDILELKLRAIQEHVSQVEGMAAVKA